MAALPTPMYAALEGRFVHAEHTMLLVALQVLAMNWPLAHTLHVDGAVTPWTQKLPAGHAILVDEFGQ